MVVDLPAPLPPRMAKSSPRRTVSSSPRSVRRVRRIAEPRIRDGYDRLLRWRGQRALRQAFEGGARRQSQPASPAPPARRRDREGRSLPPPTRAWRRAWRGTARVPPCAAARPTARGAPWARPLRRPAQRRGRRGQRLLQPLLESSTVVPSSRLTRASAARKSAAAMGSSCAVGSSKMSTSGCRRQHGGQVQKLLLPAGERRCLAVEPALHAEKKACHLGDAAADGGRIVPEALRPERPARARPCR